MPKNENPTWLYQARAKGYKELSGMEVLCFKGGIWCVFKITQLTWSNIEQWNFYKIELAPGSCHIFVVVAGACVVDLSLTSLFNLNIVDGQQKTIWKSIIAKGINVLYNSISIWCCGLYS